MEIRQVNKSIFFFQQENTYPQNTDEKENLNAKTCTHFLLCSRQQLANSVALVRERRALPLK
jgi:hypothetical protein